MRTRHVILPFIVLSLAAQAADLSQASDADLVAAYGKLRSAVLDPNHVAVTENFTLQKDAAAFEFKTGNLYFLEPVGERVAAAVFVGEGLFKLTPPTTIERRQLARFIGGEQKLEEPFREMVLVFTDSTFDELARGLKIQAGAVAPRATGVLEHFRKTFRDDLKTNIEARLLAGLCFPGHGQFLADFKGEKHGRLMFTIDPLDEEALTLLHYNNALDYADQWTSYQPAGMKPPAAFANAARITVNTTVEKNKHLTGETEIEFTPLVSGPRILPLHLLATLRVSKVTLSGGAAPQELKFIQEEKKKDADLWVILPKALVQNEAAKLTVAYAGDEVIRDAGEGNFFVGARTSWYASFRNPGGALTQRSLYHLKFQAPKDFTLIATGKLLGKHDEGKISVSEWESEVPFPVAGFNYGRYKTKSQTDSGIEVTVCSNPGLADDLSGLKTMLDLNPEAARALGITTGGLNTTGMMDRALADSVNSLRVFTHFFGPLPFKSVSVTQQPSGVFGQSWPTLVFMPYTAFLDATTRNQLGLNSAGMRRFVNEVGSHEISHQWWGHLVGWSTYHDQWLSEGFAQYSAALFLQATKGDKEFKSFMEAQKRETLETPAGERAPRNSAGPIWLGYRLSSEKADSAGQLIYSKGAYVLHMLRMMLYNAGRRDDSRFIKMMQDYTSTFAGKNASTQDFKAIVDKHFGEDMSWFFNQWVYGTEVPKISIEYSLTNTEKGAALKGTTHMAGVSPEFEVWIPIMVHFKGGSGSGRLRAKGAASPFQLDLPQMPDSVDFNVLDGVLCDLDVKKI